jgi:hypothetical protein
VLWGEFETEFETELETEFELELERSRRCSWARDKKERPWVRQELKSKRWEERKWREAF